MSLVPGWPLPPRVPRAGQRIEHEVLHLRGVATVAAEEQVRENIAGSIPEIAKQ
jgi:hypothetical protein